MKVVKLKKMKSRTKKILSNEKIEALYNSLYNKKECMINIFQKNKAFSIEDILLYNDKTEQDYLMIHHMLLNMKSLNSLTENEDQYIKLVKLLAIILNYKKIEVNRFVFKAGESKEDIYILFQGSAEVIQTNKINVRMTEEEYMLHLTKLYYYNELTLLERTILTNEHIFGIQYDHFNSSILCYLTDLKDLHPTIQNTNNYQVDNSLELQKSNAKTRKEFYMYYIYCLETAIKHNILPNRISVNSINEYINRYSPDYIPFDSEEQRISYENLAKKDCFIYQYQYHSHISSGRHFGESFTSTDARNCTVIINEQDSIVGIIDHHYYNTYLKDYIKPSASLHCQIFLKNQIFDSIPLNVFTQRYLNSFTYHLENRGLLMLIEEGKPASKIYFIKNGEYEVYSKKSIEQLTTLIRYFKNDTSDENNEEELIYKSIDPRFLTALHQFTLTNISGIDVIGFYDYTIKDKYAFSVKMKKSKGEFFSIDTHTLTDICMRNQRIYDNMNTFINTKRKILIDKLISFREKYYQQYLEYRDKNQSQRFKQPHYISTEYSTIAIDHDYKQNKIQPYFIQKNIKSNPLKTIQLKSNLKLHHSQSPQRNVITFYNKPIQLMKSISIKKQKKEISADKHSISERQAFSNKYDLTSNNGKKLYTNYYNNNTIQSKNNIQKDEKMNKSLYANNSSTMIRSNKPKQSTIRIVMDDIKPKKRNVKFDTLKDFWDTYDKNK